LRRAGEVYGVNNRCTHLNLPLQGRTALVGKPLINGCVVCPSHSTAFDVKTGEVQVRGGRAQ